MLIHLYFWSLYFLYISTYFCSSFSHCIFNSTPPLHAASLTLFVSLVPFNSLNEDGTGSENNPSILLWCITLARFMTNFSLCRWLWPCLRIYIISRLLCHKLCLLKWFWIRYFTYFNMYATLYIYQVTFWKMLYLWCFHWLLQIMMNLTFDEQEALYRRLGEMLQQGIQRMS